MAFDGLRKVKNKKQVNKKLKTKNKVKGKIKIKEGTLGC